MDASSQRSEIREPESQRAREPEPEGGSDELPRFWSTTAGDLRVITKILRDHFCWSRRRALSGSKIIARSAIPALLSISSRGRLVISARGSQLPESPTMSALTIVSASVASTSTTRPSFVTGLHRHPHHHVRWSTSPNAEQCVSLLVQHQHLILNHCSATARPRRLDLQTLPSSIPPPVIIGNRCTEHSQHPRKATKPHAGNRGVDGRLGVHAG